MSEPKGHNGLPRRFVTSHSSRTSWETNPQPAGVPNAERTRPWPHTLPPLSDRTVSSSGSCSSSCVVSSARSWGRWQVFPRHAVCLCVVLREAVPAGQEAAAARSAAVLLREHVASLNTCHFCIDATRWYEMRRSGSTARLMPCRSTGPAPCSPTPSGRPWTTPRSSRPREMSHPRRSRLCGASTVSGRSATSSGWSRASMSTTSRTAA